MKFWLNCLLVTFFTYALLAALFGILQLNAFNAFDPIGQAIGQIEISDIAFSQFREGEPKPDENVTIVNIGNLSRGEIAQQVQNVISFNPKIIAFDAFFNCESPPCDYDTLGTLMFFSAIAAAEQKGVKVVMVEKLLAKKSTLKKNSSIEAYDSIEHSDELILGNSSEGFANLPTGASHQEDLKVCREIIPVIEVNGKKELAFSVMIAMLYDSIKTKRFLARQKSREIINFRGNTPDPYGAGAPTYSGRYQFLDVNTALDTSRFHADLIKDKIVIFGFHGKDMDDKSWEDKFFTPLNRKYAGRGRPDMYGVVVHANVISMILSEDYIDLMPDWLSVLISFLVILMVSAIFFKIEENLPVWYDLLSLVIQLVLFIFFSFLMILVFSYYSIQLDFTLTLAAVALAGTSFELYYGGILRLYEYLQARFWKKDALKDH